MGRMIDADLFIIMKRGVYCGHCEKLYGTKNGKQVRLYNWGDAPCRSCGVNDMLEEIDDYADEVAKDD